MSNVGQNERATQNRNIQLFQQQLGYKYLSNWENRDNNSNMEEAELRKFLQSSDKYSDALITKVVFALRMG